MMRILRTLTTVFLLIAALSSQATVVVVVHPENGDVISISQVRNLYLGKSKVFPSGSSAVALDLDERSEAYQQFLAKVLKRSENNLSAYWARMLFSSQGRPPEKLGTVQEMLARVAMDKSAIGYVLAEDLSEYSLVRVVLTID
jgi:ABC-type phosphate transport system substrate-binding protein